MANEIISSRYAVPDHWVAQIGYRMAFTPVSCSCFSNSLFALLSTVFMNKQVQILKIENPIISNIAVMYRGASCGRKKYGLYMFPIWLMMFTIAVAHRSEE